MSRLCPLSAILPVAALFLLSAAAPNPPGLRPYCTESFAIWLSADERIDYGKDGSSKAYAFYTGGRRLVLGEGFGDRLPVGATLGATHILPTARITEVIKDGRSFGYIFENAGRGVKTIILAHDFSGFAKDKDLLARFNFGKERTCARIVVPR